jgi:hypothetical protein
MCIANADQPDPARISLRPHGCCAVPPMSGDAALGSASIEESAEKEKNRQHCGRVS